MPHFKHRRWLTAAALFAMVTLSGCGWPTPAEKAALKAKENLANEQPPQLVVPPPVTPPTPPPDLGKQMEDRPVILRVSDHVSVASVIAFNKNVGEALTTIKTNGAARQKHYDETVAVETDLMKGLDLMLSSADTARDDVDRIIRIAEDIKYEMSFAEMQYTSASNLWNARAAKTNDSSLRAINAATALWFDALAKDVPRRQGVVDDFLKEMSYAREQLADATRTLRDQRTSLSIKEKSLDPLELSPHGKEYVRQVDHYLRTVGGFYDGFFGNSAYKDVKVAKPIEKKN